MDVEATGDPWFSGCGKFKTENDARGIRSKVLMKHPGPAGWAGCRYGVDFKLNHDLRPLRLHRYGLYCLE